MPATEVVVTEPSASGSAIEHADFLELMAILSADRNASLTDLRRELHRAGSDESAYMGDDDGSAFHDDELGEALAASVGMEITDRMAAAGVGYSYEFDGWVLQTSRNVDRHLYTFLLLLALVGPKKLDGRDPTRIFEDIAGAAAEIYFGGPSDDVLCYQFGFPRRIRPSAFEAALNDLCRLLGEGEGAKDRPTRSDQKDAGLDVVVARRFPDRRSGQMIGFGQCAAGKHWRTKLTDMVPSHFCKLWMLDQLAEEPSRLFFLPFCVDADEWVPTTVKAGVVFDRCRIASLAASVGDPIRTEYRAWTKSALQRLRQ